MFEDQDFTKMNPDEAKSTLNAMQREMKALKAREADHGETKEKIERMTADLLSVKQSLAEARAASDANANNAPDAFYKGFIEGDDNTAPTKRLRLEDQTNGKGRTVARGLLDADTNDDWHRELKRLVGDRTLVRQICRDPMSRGQDVTPGLDREIAEHLAKGPAGIAKIFSDSSGIGAEWIPDVIVPDLKQELEAARRVAGLIPQMQMPEKNLLIPFMGFGGTPYLKSAPTGNDPGQYTITQPSTAQRTMTAVSLAVRYQLDEDAVEDSTVPALPVFRARLIQDLVNGEEDALINGDTASTHQDTLASWNPGTIWNASNLGGSDDHRRAWIGFRARAADVSNTTDISTYTMATWRSLRKSMDSPHGIAGERVSIMSVSAYLQTLAFDEVETVDKYGANATVISGELARADGTPIIVSEFLTADLNTSGIFDNTTTTDTGVLVVNLARFILGVRKSRSVEIAKDITRGTWELVATQRGVLHTFDSSTKKNVAFGVSLTA